MILKHFCLCVLLGLAHTTCPAAVINWQPAKIIQNEQDVDASGAAWIAYGFGLIRTLVVNGVEFNPLPESGSLIKTDKLQLEASEFHTKDSSAYSRARTANFARLEGDYRKLLSSLFQVKSGDITVTLLGLTPGTRYQIQLWSNQAEAKDGTQAFLIDGDPKTEVWLNSYGLTGGVGQFIIGTFQADGSEQTFTLNPQQANGPSINAIAVRIP